MKYRKLGGAANKMNGTNNENYYSYNGVLAKCGEMQPRVATPSIYSNISCMCFHFHIIIFWLH